MAKTASLECELRGVWSLCNGSDQVRAKIMGLLRTEHFVCPETSELYRRVIGLVSNNKEIPTIQILRTDPTLTVEAQEVLTNDIEFGLTEKEADALVDQLEQFRKLRVIYDGAVELTKSIKDSSPESVQNALGVLEKTLLHARSNYEEASVVVSGKDGNASDLVNRVLCDGKPDRILTGFKKFDEATDGFARKDLVLVAATTGGGKSVMAEQLAINMFYRTGQNRSVAIVSFEMDDEEIYARLISNLTQYDFGDVYLHRLKSANLDGGVGVMGTVDRRAVARQKWEEFNKHGEEHGNKFVVWCPTVDVTPAQVGAFLRPGNYDVIFIDYVGLVSPEEKKDLWENLGEITRGFKAVARQNDCVVVVMAQLDEDTNKVKYSKAMKHHSSYVWKWNYGEDQATSKRIQVDQEKARHCKRFPFDLSADFSTMSFYDVTPEFGPKDVTSKEENQKRTKPPKQPLYGDDKPQTPKAEVVDPPETDAEEAARRLKAKRLEMRAMGLTDQAGAGDA